MRKTFLFFSFLLVFSLLHSQQLINILADDILLQKKVAEDPTLIDRYVEYEKNFKLLIEKAQLENFLAKTDTLINGKRVIPVVVHIIHGYGPENISDAQVIDAIEKINIDLAKQNADTANTYYLFKSRAANFAIELRLAKIDPQGNCTNGIVHHYDPQTNWAYFSTMKQYAWPTNKYLNVFAVNFIYPQGITLPDGAFIGGMSPFPPSNPLSQALTGGDPDIDGVLIRQDCLGTIGTAQSTGGMGINLVNRTFTHELGHYFNLYHPFQNLMLGLIPASSGCPSFLAPNGDEVADTPPVDAATQNTSLSCYTPGSRNTCTQDNPDEPDMIENYMDYQWGYCNNIFTNGQKARVDAILMNDRRNLWSKENLIATGVLDTAYHPLCPPIADFHAYSKYVCVNDPVTFYDDSYNGIVENRQWNFYGGNASSTTDPNPTVTYTNPGVYPVTLTVSNASGSDTKTVTDYITVVDPSNNPYVPLYEGFENGFNQNWYVINESGNGWVVSDTAAATGVKSIRILNFSGNQPNSIDAFVSNGYNLNSLSTSVQLKLRFKYAYAGKVIPGSLLTDNDTAYDKLRILVSTNCGKTWSLKWIKSGSALQTVANPTQNSFKPLSLSDWRNDSVNIHIYLTQHQTNFQFKFEFISNGGNNIYVDDINIDNGTYTSMNDYANDLISMNIYPNPFDNYSTLSFTLPEENYTVIDIYDIIGNKIKTLENKYLNAGVYQYQLTKHDFKSTGIYYVRISFGEHSFVKPFTIN